MLKTWLSIVKLYKNKKNCLKVNKNYFDLVRGLSYRGFELPRVKLACENSRFSSRSGEERGETAVFAG